ncbi:hypothetical protein [Commensalibacter nepenthis]|uniref:Uncharacterized protein n=1 Tax=Commensalibacter nepenthis TaxID=3043872 RepID=A0ABT6Q6J2_9PROT|nr:hypothetical protein [Commensalibacter sp. TBRC 10068]MDI2112387.1 hypothetical protein [Commensalibacter sp. TBRC 10068]
MLFKNIFSYTLIILSITCMIPLQAKAQATQFKTPFFETEKFKIYIEDSCPLYANICDNVIYTGINKKNQQKIVIKGNTLNDSPSYNFKGYSFINKNYTYTLSPSTDPKNLDTWTLTIIQESKNAAPKTVLQENGKWNYDKSDVYESKTYKFFLLNDCIEGNVSCKGMKMNVINKQNKRQIVVNTETMSRPSNYDFLGYIMTSGMLHYNLNLTFVTKPSLDVTPIKNASEKVFSEDLIEKE